MKTKLMGIAVGLLAGAVLLGCAKKRPESRTARLLEGEQDVDLYEHLTGIDDSSSVAVEKDPDAERPQEAVSDYAEENIDGEAIGGGRGAFVARLLVNGKEVKGSFTVTRSSGSGEVVKQDIPTGKEIRLDPGYYDITFTTGKIVGNPKLTQRDVEIPAGQRIKRDVKFPVGKITLVTGGRCVKKPIRIREQGATDWYKGKFYTCVEMSLMAGQYEAEMGTGKRGTPISGIQVYDGGIRDVLIRPK
ncbi:MAG: hypothetical protein QNJ97_26675 [Myxococcota bacterium]|nr:hypothetical protein [Myxococcota bacterium]